MPPRPAKRESSRWNRKPAEVADPFLRKALNLAVDGMEMSQIRSIMELDIDLVEQRGEAEAKAFETAGGYSPTIGIIGAVLGLMQVMKNLANIDRVGTGIAALLWRLFMAWLRPTSSFCRPAASCGRACAPRCRLRELMLLGRARHRGRAEPETDSHPARRPIWSSRRQRIRPPRPASAPPHGPRKRRADLGTQETRRGAREPRALAGFLRRFHHPAVRLLRGDVRLVPNR